MYLRVFWYYIVYTRGREEPTHASGGAERRAAHRVQPKREGELRVPVRHDVGPAEGGVAAQDAVHLQSTSSGPQRSYIHQKIPKRCKIR